VTRNDLQERAGKFIEQHNAVILEFGTGVGKTKTVLEAIHGKSLVVYKQSPHYQNWLAEISKWNINKDITFITYDSLHHLEGTTWDFIVLDEAHGGTDLRIEKLKQLITKKWIFLSATLPYDKKILLRQLADFKIMKFSLDDAIEYNMLPEGSIFIVNRFLDNKTRNCVYQKHFKKYNTTITVDYQSRHYHRNVNLDIECTEQEYYSMLDEDVNRYRDIYFKERQDYQKTLWLQAGSKRKKWLNSIKTDIARKLIDKLGDKRIVIFAYTKEQIELLHDGEYVYSKFGKKKNTQTIQDFNDLHTNRLFNLKVLNEGMNLTAIDAGIIIGIDGKPLSSIQRMGRVWRSNRPEVYFIKIPYTQDDKYFIELQKETKQQFIILNDYDL